ncbi:MAG: lipocalin-like domain-containing protein [Prevotella sp.]
MKRNIIQAIVVSAIAAISMMTLTGCTIETSGNGDLDGYWHLTQIDTLETGGSADKSEELIFWAVQIKLLNVVDRNTGGDYFLRFYKSESTLRVYEPYGNDRMVGDIKTENPQELAPFGINVLDETFAIEKLTGGKMILNDGFLRLWFVKM